MTARDHGGGLDAAIAAFGGTRDDWIDLSTGINPVPYPLPAMCSEDWTALPDQKAQQALISAARQFWGVPEAAAVLAAPGASALIAKIPGLRPKGSVQIPTPTYNEHAAAFDLHGWTVTGDPAPARVIVHPNNPDGRWYGEEPTDLSLHIIDESFCDVAPDRSLIAQAAIPGTIVLKSFGKFWGLAGLRLGFAIGDPDLISRLRDMLGPWAVSGPALRTGTTALQDAPWSVATRIRLNEDAARLDALVTRAKGRLLGGTSLFRLYHVEDAAHWQRRFAEHKIWTRIFPYSDTMLRLGLPAPDQWTQVETAL